MNHIKLNYKYDTNSKLAMFLALARRKRIIALTQRNIKLKKYLSLFFKFSYKYSRTNLFPISLPTCSANLLTISLRTLLSSVPMALNTFANSMPFVAVLAT